MLSISDQMELSSPCNLTAMLDQTDCHFMQTKQAVISRKRNQNFPPVFMNGDELDTSASFAQLCLSLSSNLTWKTHIHSLAKHASQKLGFLARARGFSHLLTFYLYTNLNAPTSGVVLQNLLSVFSTKSSPKPFVS